MITTGNKCSNHNCCRLATGYGNVHHYKLFPISYTNPGHTLLRVAPAGGMPTYLPETHLEIEVRVLAEPPVLK